MAATLVETVLTAAGTIAAGGITGYFTARRKAKQDIEAWNRTRRAMVRDSAVALLRDTVEGIAAAGHALCSLTREAECDPDNLHEAISSYEKALNDIMPKVLGGQAAIATFCPDTARKVKDAIAFIQIEATAIDHACISYKTSGAAALSGRKEAALSAYEKATDACSSLGANLLGH
jgi:hypothetical protein